MKHKRLWLVVLFLVCVLAGCGVSLKGYERFDYLKGGPGKEFPKKVLWLKAQNQGPYEPEQLEGFQNAIIGQLKGHKEIQLTQNEALDKQKLSFDEKKGKFGIPGVLKEQAGKEGWVAVVQVTLISPTVDVRRTGVWPLRKTKMFVSVGARIVALDLIGETVILNQVERQEVPFYYDPVAEEDPTLYQEALEKASKKLTKKVSKTIVENLRDRPWVATVTEVKGKMVTIPVGRTHGIKPGQEFYAYERSEEIKAFDGRTYPVWGKRIATLKVKEVEQDRSILEVISGSEVSEGHLLRLIR